MRNYINSLKSLFGFKSPLPKAEDVEDVEEREGLDGTTYIEDKNLSCLITVRLDSSKGDFNVIIDPVDISADSASVTGLMMYLLNSGKLATFFVEAYEFWQKEDPERTAFTQSVMEEWLSTSKLYQEGEVAYQQDAVAIRATEVFSTNN
tara:strand:- start:64479 stop:64925 length:447 start_codon:yes stop_codon:yes gene_type:complete